LKNFYAALTVLAFIVGSFQNNNQSNIKISLKMSKSKNLIFGLSMVLVLASGFVFGHFIFKNKTENNLYAENINRERTVQNITDTRENAITRTVKDVSSAVVGISVTEVREYRDPFADDPFFRLEAVGSSPEHPLGDAEVGSANGDRLLLVADQTVEVPPIGAIGDEVEKSRRRPFRPAAPRETQCR
jgi:hypothetical protein